MNLEKLLFSWDSICTTKDISKKLRGMHGFRLMRREITKARDDMVLELSAFVLKQDYESRSHTVSFNVPKTWWDAFKLWAFPVPMLRRWPARFKTLSQTVEFKVGAFFPEASFKVPLSPFGAPVYFTQLEKID